MMAAIQEKARQLYREIAQIPVATGGRIFRSGDELYEIEIKWSQKDLERGNKLLLPSPTWSAETLARRNSLYSVATASNVMLHQFRWNVIPLAGSSELYS
uniref:Uncharacterized protein n=1 Tax=Amphimedon queenslandica TaxID=400682 RepID=A0A1X7UKT3_AMPQE